MFVKLSTAIFLISYSQHVLGYPQERAVMPAHQSVLIFQEEGKPCHATLYISLVNSRELAESIITDQLKQIIDNISPDLDAVSINNRNDQTIVHMSCNTTPAASTSEDKFITRENTAENMSSVKNHKEILMQVSQAVERIRDSFV